MFKRKMGIKLLVLLLVLSFTVVGCGSTGTDKPATPPPAAEKVKLRWGTTGVGTALNTYGAAIASVVNKYSTKVQIEVYPGAGNNILVQDLVGAKSQVISGSSQTSYDAYNGTGLFQGTKFEQLRVLFPLMYGYTHLIVPENSKIKTPADLKGKKVALTTKGSSSYEQGVLVLKGYGMTESDIKPVYLSWTEQVEALKDGDVDAVIFGTAMGSPVIVDAMTSKAMRFVPVSDEAWAKMEALIPKGYFVRATIPGGVYPGQKDDVLSFAVVPNWMVTKDLPDDVVTDIIKTFWEHKAEAEQIYATIKQTDAELINKPTPIPYHPAAEKFFKGIGVMK